MLFNSFQFPVFFALFFVFYFALPKPLKKPWLIFAGCYFYASAIPKFLILLLVLILCDYFFSHQIERAQNKKIKNLVFIFSIFLNIGILAVFKLLAEYGRQDLPPGLSFHTLQSVAYLTEVYRQKFKAEKNFLNYSLYILFWPQLVAGPIERPQNLLNQLKLLPVHFSKYWSAGFSLILIGFIKKSVVADRLAYLTDHVFANPSVFSGLPLFVGMAFFGFQVYCDFSGYSDIARGCAKLMGIHLVENFKQPYFSYSPSKFVSRWHISLTGWFRDYVYAPLGGNSASIAYRTFLILFVWVLFALWHSPRLNMVLSGLYFGCIVLVSHYFNFRRAGVFAIPLTCFLSVFPWGFFRARTLDESFHIYTHLIAPIRPGNLFEEAWFSPFFLIACSSAILLVLAIDYAIEKKLYEKFSPVLKWLLFYAGIALVLSLGIFEQKKFIYYQF